MSIYLWMLVWVLVFGAIMPQKGPDRKYYIILMAIIHSFVCGFRYMHLTGDLMKYHHTFNISVNYGWFSEEIFNGGRNAGFYLLMKLVNHLTGGDYQFFLLLVAVIVEIAVAMVIYRYSPAPWMSYLVWNGMAFYIFGFSAVKQALAMAFVMLSVIGIMEGSPKFYLGMMFLAGMIHTPALIFLPAYWLAQYRVSRKMVLFYLTAAALMYVFRNQFVELITSFYYDEDVIEIFSGGLGNRFVMLLGFCVFGVVLKGFESKRFEALFHIMAVAAILQMLSSFNNVFTRLTDYYFQFSVIYLPMVFFNNRDGQKRPVRLVSVIPFNRQSMRVLAGAVVLFVIWFYYTYNININIASAVDNYLNFRFMWDVK